MSAGGKKFDGGKAPLDLIPYEFLEETAKVLGFGAAKYDRANWAQGISYSRLISALMRHIGQFNGLLEDRDPESDLLHLGHASCNLAFLIWMYKNRPDLDDRWRKAVIIPEVKNAKSSTRKSVCRRNRRKRTVRKGGFKRRSTKG